MGQAKKRSKKRPASKRNRVDVQVEVVPNPVGDKPKHPVKSNSVGFAGVNEPASKVVAPTPKVEEPAPKPVKVEEPAPKPAKAEESAPKPAKVEEPAPKLTKKQIKDATAKAINKRCEKYHKGIKYELKRTEDSSNKISKYLHYVKKHKYYVIMGYGNFSSYVENEFGITATHADNWAKVGWYLTLMEEKGLDPESIKIVHFRCVSSKWKGEQVLGLVSKAVEIRDADGRDELKEDDFLDARKALDGDNGKTSTKRTDKQKINTVKQSLQSVSNAVKSLESKEYEKALPLLEQLFDIFGITEEESEEDAQP